MLGDISLPADYNPFPQQNTSQRAGIMVADSRRQRAREVGPRWGEELFQVIELQPNWFGTRSLHAVHYQHHVAITNAARCFDKNSLLDSHTLTLLEAIKH